MTISKYQHAPHKPERVLVNYTTVRAAELKAIWSSMASDRKVQNISSDFSQEPGEDDNVQDCIDFLHSIDLLSRGGDHRVVTPLNDDLFPDLSFEARVVYHLRQQQRPNDHLSRIQNVALKTADRSVTLKTLLPEVNDDLDEYDFKWNLKKLKMWQSLSTQLGLVSHVDTRGVILNPCRRLLYDILDLHNRKKDSNGLYEALSWIESNFFDVFETQTGTLRVHSAVSDVLENMESEDVLSLRGMSDATDAVTLPESVHNQNSRSINVYELNSRPDSPAYQYPLIRFNQVIQ